MKYNKRTLKKKANNRSLQIKRLLKIHKKVEANER